jgi:hypothetical protein
VTLGSAQLNTPTLRGLESTPYNSPVVAQLSAEMTFCKAIPACASHHGYFVHVAAAHLAVSKSFTKDLPKGIIPESARKV